MPHENIRTVHDVVPGVHVVIHGHTNCYVVEGEDGVTLVDAAFPKTWTAVRQCLADVGRSASEIRGLVITHGHFDHVGFAHKLQRCYGVPVWAGAADAHILRHPYRYRPARPRLTYPPTHPRSWPVLASMVRAGALRVPGLEADHLVRGRVVARPARAPGAGPRAGAHRRRVRGAPARARRRPHRGRPRDPRPVHGPQGAPRGRPGRDERRRGRHALAGGIGALDVPAVLTGHGEPWLQGSRSAVDAARLAGVA